MSKLQSKISMSFTLFLGIAFCGIASCVILSYILISYNTRHLFDAGKNRIADFVEGLSYDIERSGFPSGTDNTVAEELFLLAEMFLPNDFKSIHPPPLSLIFIFNIFLLLCQAFWHPLCIICRKRLYKNFCPGK